MSLEHVRWTARKAIDEAAGEARLRYITEVPGQMGVYLVKLQQAEAFVASQGVQIGSYIAAEAEALNVSAATVAQGVIDTNAAWNSTVGPAIEATRMAAKAAVGTAEDEAGVLSVQQAALAALGQM